MDKSQNALMRILESDNTNIDVSLKALRFYKLLDLYEGMPGLFEGLIQELGQYLSDLPIDPFEQINSDGTKKLDLSVLLRIHMTLSAYQQCTQATGHLLRGHLSDVYGHIRRAIEAAGIAYLSKSEPDLGEVYLSRDRKKLERRTSTHKILPKDHPLTNVLHRMIHMASGQVHNNFDSFVNRMRHETSTNQEKSRSSFTLLFHEADPQDPTHFLRMALWILVAVEHITRLLAASFDLPNNIWHQQLGHFQAELASRYREFFPHIWPSGRPPVEGEFSTGETR